MDQWPTSQHCWSKRDWPAIKRGEFKLWALHISLFLSHWVLFTHLGKDFNNNDGNNASYSSLSRFIVASKKCNLWTKISYKSGLLFFPCRLSSVDSAASAAELVTWDPPVELDSAVDIDCKTRQDESQQQEMEEGVEFEPRLKLPAHLKDLKVQVSHVNSPSSFYVQFTENSRQLKRSVIANWSKPVIVSCCLFTLQETAVTYESVTMWVQVGQVVKAGLCACWDPRRRVVESRRVCRRTQRRHLGEGACLQWRHFQRRRGGTSSTAPKSFLFSLLFLNKLHINSQHQGDALWPRRHPEAQCRPVTAAAATPGGLIGAGVQPHRHQVSRSLALWAHSEFIGWLCNIWTF